MTILDQNEKQICREEIDTYAEKRIEGAELIQKDFPEGSYTIQFERVGKSPNGSPEKRGWVEVGTLKIRTEKKEIVDRSQLEEELTICDGLNKDKYTEESWNKLQKAVNSARELLNKKDEETCTSEMNDKANEVRNARNSLQEIKVDTSALNDALKAAKSISREGYTEESFEALTQSILEAEALLNGTYTQKYNKIKDMTQGNATDASWNDFTRLRELANAILTDPNATPAEVSDILNQLNTFEFAYKDDPDEGGNKDPQEPLEPQNPQNPNSGNQGNTNTSHADTSVKTGDSTHLLLPLATMCSIIGLLYIMHKKRKLG